MMALGAEYTRRYGRIHKSIAKCKEPLSIAPKNINTYVSFTQPPQCMPDEYKDKCSIQAYWNYYIGDKYRIANPKKEKIYEKRINKPN